jgi:hypothetical protein
MFFPFPVYRYVRICKLSLLAKFKACFLCIERSLSLKENTVELRKKSFSSVVDPFSTSTVRARIYNRLWSPGIDSEKSIPSAYVARRAGAKNGLSYWPARLGIDSWAPQRVYKYGLRSRG